MKRIAPDQTPEQAVKANFVAKGVAVNEWAQKNGFKPGDVYDVLNGRNKARRGNGHRIAVKLGLKAAA